MTDQATRERILKSVPYGWTKEVRVAYLVGMMVGARVPELGPLLERLTAEIAGLPAEFIEVKVREAVGVIQVTP